MVDKSMHGMKASKILSNICPYDIYSSNVGVFNPTREHIVPRTYLPGRFHNDLNNLWVCNSRVNNLRGCMPFGNVSLHSALFIDGRNGNIIPINKKIRISDLCLRDKTYFLPPPQSRGPIARTCMYMTYVYPELSHILFRSVIDKVTLEMWNDLYPVEDWEKDRAERIVYAGYPKNPFVL